MKIEIRKKQRDLVQITTPDERWYANKPLKEIDELASLSPADFYPARRGSVLSIRRASST